VVFDLAAARPSDDWGRINAAGALLLWPATRLRALALVGSFPIAEQLDVMHEIFHAHDQLRPWSAGFDFGDDLLETSVDGAAFLRLYGVFRGLAWRLWEARLGIADVLQALDREADAAHLGEPERAALLEYLGRNALGLSSGRSSAMALVRSLEHAAAARADPSLAPFRTRLAFLARAGSVDAATLADAWRLP